MPEDPLNSPGNTAQFIPAVNIPQSADIDVCVRHDAWETQISGAAALVARAVAATAKTLGAHQEGDLSVAFVNDAQIQALNSQYRGKDKPTNVLSFPGDAHNPCMGDIVIAFETTANEAIKKGISLSDHTAHLIVHGYLHLCGYDHEIGDDAVIMEALEIKTLAQLGIRNPYESDENV